MTMSEDPYAIIRLLREDRRYALEAYQFVRDALSFGQNMLGLGEDQVTEEDEPSAAEEDHAPPPAQEAPSADWAPPRERHLTGQQLCEAIRCYALEQYGYMAKVVLNRWGIYSTGDFGEIVYNLIRIGMMKKSRSDRREDFDDCYDFEEAFQQQFEITRPD